ncbi:hypothetical protein LCGC14_2782250, partial [marine sediment metagenome]
GSYVKYCRDSLKLEPLSSMSNPTSKKVWRERLLKEGRENLKSGKRLVISEIVSSSSNRYIYKFFKNFGEYNKKLLKY